MQNGKNGMNPHVRQCVRGSEDYTRQKPTDWILKWLMALCELKRKTKNEKMTDIRNFMVPRE